MNILLVSNNDMCRSRMAQKILSSFGHGIRIFTSGVLPGRVIPSSVVGVMEQNGYDCSRKKASDVDIYCLLYTSPSPRDPKTSRMPSSA